MIVRSKGSICYVWVYKPQNVSGGNWTSGHVYSVEIFSCRGTKDPQTLSLNNKRKPSLEASLNRMFAWCSICPGKALSENTLDEGRGCRRMRFEFQRARFSSFPSLVRVGSIREFSDDKIHVDTVKSEKKTHKYQNHRLCIWQYLPMCLIHFPCLKYAQYKSMSSVVN